MKGSFSLQLREFAEKASGNMTEFYRAVTISIGNSVVRLSPVDTGRFRGEWQFTVGPATSGTGREDKSGSATVQQIASDVIEFKAGEVGYISNLMPYAIPLEYEGLSKQAPEGMVRITMARIQQIIAAEAAKLRD